VNAPNSPASPSSCSSRPRHAGPRAHPPRRVNARISASTRKR
jgi:hypothetical protein